jgi:hypothetical protein
MLSIEKPFYKGIGSIQLIVIGKELVGKQTTGMMVHPEWRKKGILTQLNWKSIDEIKARKTLHFKFFNSNSWVSQRKWVL